MSKYWEKTVEYSFVAQACRSGVDFLAPLGGKEERGVGDGMFGKEEKLILVEFKVGEGSMALEEEKFDDYSEAHLVLNGRDSHHFFVYALSPVIAEKQLPLLGAKTYFGGVPLQSAMECFKHGTDAATFKEYVEDLLKYRKVDGRSSSGQVGFEALTNVIGVSASGKQVSTVTLDQYVEFEMPHLALQSKPTNTPKMSSGSTLGMN